jgi:hypothetical protein
VQTQLGQGIAAGDAYNFVRHLARPIALV